MIHMKVFTADFETTTPETCENETWVWSYGTYEIGKDNSFQWGTQIEHFMDWCQKGENKLVYFHNLKFDGYFILDYLLNNGFKWSKKKKEKPQPKTFRTIISQDNLFYEIEVIFNVHKKRYKKCTFRDSYKKLPFTVERIAKAFNLPLAKLDIDYKKVRPKGYKPTPEEIQYLRNDVEIMAKALEIQIEEGLEKMTIGSDSLNTFKNIIGKDHFERLFPVLAPDVNSFIRKSYKGGFTYVNPKHKGKIIQNGQVYDVNSLYPAMMLKPMPYGVPIKFEGEYQHFEEYPLYIQKLFCEFKLKEGKIPSIQLKGNNKFVQTEYLSTSGGQPVELTLTNVDLDLFFDHYHVYVHEWLGGYMFHSIENIFREYIEKFMKIKVVSTGAKRELAKLLLNNLYGKFATTTDCTGKRVEFDEEKQKVKLVLDDYEERDPIYTAVGSFITSYARETTIRSAQALGDRFIYADTDSLHIVGLEPVAIDIDPHELGKWKHEGDFRKGKFIRAKSYIEEIVGVYEIKDGEKKFKPTPMAQATHFKTKITCAGMPDNVKKSVTFENFNVGQIFEGKLYQRVVKGGVLLVEGDFQIKIS